MTFLLRKKEEVRGMNQNERDDLAIYLGLQDFEVKLVEVEGSPKTPDTSLGITPTLSTPIGTT